MLDMLGKVLPLDQLAATTPTTEIIAATGRGANVYHAAMMLRDELRARGFPNGRAATATS